MTVSCFTDCAYHTAENVLKPSNSSEQEKASLRGMVIFPWDLSSEFHSFVSGQHYGIGESSHVRETVHKLVGLLYASEVSSATAGSTLKAWIGGTI